MTNKRSLKVLGKSLATEILPDPTQAQTGTHGPRQRVLDRFKQLTRNVALLATTAGLSAGCGETQTGLSNPLPSGGAGGAGGGAGVGVAGGAATAGTAGVSAGTGGYSGDGVVAGYGGTGGYAGDAGSGGIAGYGVVDPLPPPYFCPTPDQLAAEAATATYVSWDHFAINISVQLTSSQYASSTYLQSLYTSEMLPVNASVTSSAQPAAARLELTSGRWPAVTHVTLGFQCNNASGVVAYQYMLTLHTGTPAADGSITFEVGANDADAGL